MRLDPLSPPRSQSLQINDAEVVVTNECATMMPRGVPIAWADAFDNDANVEEACLQRRFDTGDCERAVVRFGPA